MLASEDWVAKQGPLERQSPLTGHLNEKKELAGVSYFQACKAITKSVQSGNESICQRTIKKASVYGED